MTNRHSIQRLKNRYIAEGIKLAKKKLLKEGYDDEDVLWNTDEINGHPIPPENAVWALLHCLEGYVYNPFCRFKKRMQELEKAFETGSVNEQKLDRIRVEVADAFYDVMDGFRVLAGQCEELKYAISLD